METHTTNPKWIKDFLGRGFIYYQLSSILVWRHILSDLQKRPDKRGWNELQYHKKFHYFYRTEISIADEKEQSAIKELFKLKIGTKKEDLIFYTT